MIHSQENVTCPPAARRHALPIQLRLVQWQGTWFQPQGQQLWFFSHALGHGRLAFCSCFTRRKWCRRMPPAFSGEKNRRSGLWWGSFCRNATMATDKVLGDRMNSAISDTACKTDCQFCQSLRHHLPNVPSAVTPMSRAQPCRVKAHVSTIGTSGHEMFKPSSSVHRGISMGREWWMDHWILGGVDSSGCGHELWRYDLGNDTFC